MSAFSLVSPPPPFTGKLLWPDYALLPCPKTSMASVYRLIANHFRRNVTR
uniref:Uncharacterized protein n=1 Tax=uncultured Verrucomicrobiales bacterium HF0200_39L05 TaxID=710997 RepID=E0XUP4_9BACT|nr:hypothetical protein [uncultured Verrucomicrobiales bacterium HF0200_39L05]